VRLRIAVSTLVLVISCVGTPNAQMNGDAPKPPAIQNPSGEFGIGRIAFEWTDSKRKADNGDPATSEAASLMVYVWYPTDAPARDAKGILFPGAREIDAAPDLIPGFKGGPIFGGNWSDVVSGAIGSHAQNSAPIARAPHQFPVVIFSPGAFGTSFEYSGAIENLVSHGYVVASIEHTYETFAVAYPDGKVKSLPMKRIQQQYLAPPNSSPDQAQEKLNLWNRRRVDFRAADISFVLDKLTELNRSASKTQFAGRFKLSRVAAVGHSRGGWSAVVACRRDSRLRACVNEDGSAGGEGLDLPGSTRPSQPILYVEIPKTVEVSKDWGPLSKLHLTPEQWLQQWHEKVRTEFATFPSGGNFVVLNLAGMEHYSFSDRKLLEAERLKNPAKVEIETKNLESCEKVTSTFLDRYLKDDANSILKSDGGTTVEQFNLSK
jgi:dienelactone hydrolase